MMENEKQTKQRREKDSGQLTEREGNRFVARVFLGRDESGKRRYSSKTVVGKKKAKEWLNKAIHDKNLGVFVEPSSETVSQYLDRWLEASAKLRVRDRTFNDYTKLLERYVREPLGRVKLAALKPAHIQNLYASMLERGLSPRVVRYTHAVLSSALKQAVRQQVLIRNPADLADLPRKEQKEMKAFSPEEAGRFLAAVRVTPHAALFTFALTTGMRPQEYLALKWTDVDLDKGTATVRRAIVWSQKKGDGWRFAEPKTPRSRRTIPLPASTVRLLSEHKRRQAEQRLRIGSEWHDHGLVFTTSVGNPHTLSSLTNKSFKPALVNAKLSTSFRLYDLRHSMATLSLANGENPKVVAERLGHSTIVLTLDTYSHVLPDMQRQAAERIETLLFRTGS